MTLWAFFCIVIPFKAIATRKKNMSLEIGRSALELKAPPRLAHTEYCSNFALVRRVTGKDPVKDESAWRDFQDSWDMDFIWITHDGPHSWAEKGRSTDMGHAEFLEGGVDRRNSVTCPFKDVEEIYSFDAVAEYGLENIDELTQFYESVHQAHKTANPNQFCTGGYYKTLVSGAIEAFGWDMLLTAAADKRRFERTLDSIFRLTLHHVQAWARTSIEAFICHDDMVWTAGPFMHPEFYRSAIFPRYKELWKPLIAAGKKVLYCSDGNWTMFGEDIAEAGAHGFIFEPITDLDVFVKKFGKSHVLMGSKLDCRTLTFEGEQRIAEEVDATIALAKDCPGFFFAVGNHIPSNVPVENALFFMDYLRDRWRRNFE